MQNLQNYVFDDQLVRVVMIDGEPWFVAKDAGAALGLTNVREATADFDEAERRVSTADTSAGMRDHVLVSEPGLYRLVFQSRKPEAKRFMRWLAHDVLPALRKTGSYTMPGIGHNRPPADPAPVFGLSSIEVSQRLEVLKQVRILYGPERARAMWPQLGLPEVPPSPPTMVDDGLDCLAFLLRQAADERDGTTIRALIQAAIEGEGESTLTASRDLVRAGIRVFADGAEDSFMVSSAHAGTRRLFAGTEWAGGKHVYALRRVPGASRCGPRKIGGYQTRGVLIGAEWLDEGRLSHDRGMHRMDAKTLDSATA